MDEARFQRFERVMWPCEAITVLLTVAFPGWLLA
jgi:hypothetical protein